jgi:prepilin-type N-terminal cleavage/methylation domain-containing protein
MRSARGFTLLEVIVALTIMTFLSLFTVQAIQRAISTKAKVQKDIDKNSTLRDALRVMERDINMAFNYRDVSIALYNQAQSERRASALAAKKPKTNPNPNGGAAQDPATAAAIAAQPTIPLTPEEEAKYRLKTEKIWTQFQGESDNLSFTSLSNVRMMEDSPISSQAEIGYHIKSCRRRSTQEQSSKCLWRRVSNYIHEDITKDGEETVLLENVTEFKLRYLKGGKDQDPEWVDTWKSAEGADDSTRNKFPYAVEITIEIKDPNGKDKPLRMTTVAAIRNPNNPPEANSGLGNAAGPGGAQIGVGDATTN